MPRGVASEPGETKISPNGYHYTRTDTKWRLTHHIIAEEQILKRPLSTNEMVVFIGPKTDLSPDNIKVIQKGKVSARRKLAKLEAQRQEIEAQIDLLKAELNE